MIAGREFIHHQVQSLPHVGRILHCMVCQTKKNIFPQSSGMFCVTDSRRFFLQYGSGFCPDQNLMAQNVYSRWPNNIFNWVLWILDLSLTLSPIL
jgi:hypothetical protein